VINCFICAVVLFGEIAGLSRLVLSPALVVLGILLNEVIHQDQAGVGLHCRAAVHP
jgi:hypothetical protein